MIIAFLHILVLTNILINIKLLMEIQTRFSLFFYQIIMNLMEFQLLKLLSYLINIEIKDQLNKSQIEIVKVQIKDVNSERYFTYYEQNLYLIISIFLFRESYYSKNPQVGFIIIINEKQGRLQRSEQECLQAQQLHIII
ncbi:unnamed protein product [Paramecium sonneborni]|uniref:Uncharacterized protein n=1 Tax=Paramecium sonneborni TaxID=65129 RepID=A0A8S1MIN8_9CILI|nr:unnamed protein product [Paramecium sonneborni]